MNFTSVLQFIIAKGIGEVAIKKAIDLLENNDEITWDLLCDSENTLTSMLKLRSDIAQNIISEKYRAQKLAEKLFENNVKIILENDKAYPRYLKATLEKNCPSVLFAQGNISLLNTDSVGFCGSRKVSPKGLKIAEECAKQLVEKNISVISGYAAGTDLTAHKSALNNGGNTIFVLAEGILRSKIKFEIKDLLTDDNHVFVSQFIPEITWNVGNAMKRNGTIIGLSRAMILVESGKDGGTFAAGEQSLKVGCPLFVIDFSKPEVSAEANPYFISKGGIPIRGKKEGIPNLKNLFNTIETNSREINIDNFSNKAIQLKIEI